MSTATLSPSLEQQARFEAHYASGPVPWDTQKTPPEVIAFWMSGRLPWTGRALELGCGTGTNVRYLARLGIDALGVDFVIQPLMTAAARVLVAEPRMAPRVNVLLADVTRLPLSGLGAHYVLDVGCLHGVPVESRAGYIEGVLANIAPGGYYHLFGFDSSPELAQSTERIPGLGDSEVVERFGDRMEVIAIERGRPERHACRWYLLRKT